MESNTKDSKLIYEKKKFSINRINLFPYAYKCRCQTVTVQVLAAYGNATLKLEESQPHLTHSEAVSCSQAF